jgi:hypothetical protein
MPIKSSGTLSFSDIRNEAGPAGTSSVSVSAYRGAMAGIPLSGPIEMSDFYGKAFLVTEIITEDTVWSPKINFARFIHIFVVGAGGSGGHGWPARNVGPFGNTDGVAGGSGGGGGGTAYSKIVASTAGPSTVIIGQGGAGVRRTSEDGYVNGNAGTDTTFVGSGLNMTARGGKGGAGDADTGGAFSGENQASAAGGAGGTASGGNVENYTGGSGGNFLVRDDGPDGSASGGGAPRFGDSDPTKANDSGLNTTSQGMKVSQYSVWPSILSSYVTERNQTPVLSSTNLNFDASAGTLVTGGTASPIYGAGSGGSGAESSSFTGDGGDGIVIIVYEI